jgi:hypothetical protein
MDEFGDSFFGGVTTERLPDGTAFAAYGTKWWDFEAEIDEDCTELTICGDSAWAPPSHLLQKISEHYPVEISLEYEEGGCDFAGTATFKGGVAEDNCMRFWEYQLVMGNYDMVAEELVDWFRDCKSSYEWNDRLKELTHGWKHPFDTSSLMLTGLISITPEEMSDKVWALLRANKITK